VDVLRVAGEAERALTVRMAEACGRLRLPLRARSGLAFTLHDLERNLDPRLRVEREPDRPRAAAPERAQGPVAAEDELGGRERRSFSHPNPLCVGRRNSFRREPIPLELTDRTAAPGAL